MPRAQRRTASAPEWLVGGGEMGERIRSHDWSATPLGSLDAWPQSLRSAVSILLPSRAQICLFWGPELVAIYNDAYAPVLGVKHPRALGRPAREMWSELWEPVLRNLLEGVLATGNAFWASDHPFALERYGYPEETYFDISYDPVRAETGRVGGVFCIVNDTTVRVLGERRLRILRDLGNIASRARSVEDVARTCSAVFEANPLDIAFAQIWDANGEPMAGCRIHLHQPRIASDTAVGDERVLDAVELQAIGRASAGAWSEPVRAAVALPIVSPGQAPYGRLLVGASPRLPLNDAYRDFLRLVAANIAGSIAAARALEEQRARAETLAQVDRAKTTFFSNVSHEFRSPLTLILGPIEDVLAEQLEPLADVQRERLETVHRNALRLLKLVNTLLDFSRIEAGRMNATFVAVDLSRLTAELASNFSSVCEKAGLDLRIECQPLSRTVYVDPDLWEKIVLNLLSNAFKYTFDGAITVTLRESANGIELRVQDTGTGIAAEHLPRLFERFHRIEAARGRTHEGSGIGLAFVRELVRMHGGDVRVESVVGQGSTFIVSVPFGSAHLPQQCVRTTPAQATNDTRASVFVSEAFSWLDESPVAVSARRPVDGADATTILVVDDNADMRSHLSRVLGQQWSVTAVSDGLEALDALARRSFDLILSDVMMPNMDGFDLLQRVKSNPSTQDTPVILLSARAGEESRVDALTVGADDYIVKPFTAAQLLAQVSAQLSITRARRENARERGRLLAREREAKREAQVQRQHLFSLFMQAPNPIVILRGRDLVIELANPPTCRVWGRTYEDVIGRPLFEALPEIRGQGFEALLERVMDTGTTYIGKEVEARLDRRGSGVLEPVYLNFVYTPLREVDDQVAGILVTAFDVTDEVRAREQMSTLQRAAESANRAKDEFLAMLGHELRNPLSPIVSALQIMRMRGANAPELDIVERQVAHLTRLVDDLLDVSRITRGKVELRMEPTEVARAIVHAIETASPLIEQRRHPIDMSGVPEHGLVVNADAPRLAQIFSNLITNAAKYSEPGSPITITARRAGTSVRVSVVDRGLGITADMLETIFDLFVQQRQTIARAEGGLGLGLAIVRNLTAMHGGKVTARSEGPGKGSEFVVELPLVDLPATAEIKAPEAAVRDSTGSRRVLVVDDNIDAASTLGELLRASGHVVRLAHDGSTALALAGEFAPEVALVDIGLPLMDGYEVARRLRRECADNALRIVAVSGYGAESDRRRSAEAGFDAHLVKPVDVDKLQQVLRSTSSPTLQ